jgi:hypothetical protein
MDEKHRLIYDKASMVFGSMMKSVDPSQLDDDHFWLYAEEAWRWSVEKVTELVNQLYNGTLPGAQNGTQATTLPPPACPSDKPVSDL